MASSATSDACVPFEELPEVEPLPAEPLDAEPLDAEPLDAEPLDAEPLDAEPLDAEPPDAESEDSEWSLPGAEPVLPEPFEFAPPAALLPEFAWLELWAEDPEFLLAAAVLPPGERLPDELPLASDRLPLFVELDGLAAASSEKIAPLPEELLRVLLPDDPVEAEFEGGGMLNATGCHSVRPGALRALVRFVLLAALQFAVLFSLKAFDHLAHGVRTLRRALPDLHFAVARRAGSGHDERLLAQGLFEPRQKSLVIPQGGRVHA